MEKRPDHYWNPVNESSKENQTRQLRSILEKNHISSEIVEEVLEQLTPAMQDFENSDIIFVFTADDEYVVTGIHVPAESLNGASGPVLMRGKTEKSIIAAFSQDFIIQRLEKVDSVANKSGLPAFADAAWVSELEELAEMTMMELRLNPPENWDELLPGEK